MKILYGIQGTGNGHISRAKALIPYFQKYGEVDLLISGIDSQLRLPFDIRYKCKGLGFVFGKKGGIDYLNTYLKNHIRSFLKELKSIPIEEYDLIISDFEPITAWAAQLKKKHCVALSNQCALKHFSLPLSKQKDVVGNIVLQYYAPSSSEYGISYESTSSNVFTPIIRDEIRKLDINEENFYIVYLPSYTTQRIQKVLSKFESVEFKVFSKEVTEEYKTKNLKFLPINNDTFLSELARCKGAICAAGFGITSELIFLGKKFLVIPQSYQYEQKCNAIMLKYMGVSVVKKLKLKHLAVIKEWLENGKAIKVDYPNQTQKMVETIIYNEFLSKDNYLDYLTNQQFQTQDF